MKRLLVAAAAALALAACADNGTVVGSRSTADAARTDVVPFPAEWIFTTQTPASTLDATGGWEVGTRFTVEKGGYVKGFRFWKAVGETGSHTARLWTSSGTLLASKTFTGEGASGWQVTMLTNDVSILPGTYIVSVNTNVKQVKTFAYFGDHGPIYRTYMSADAGAYGQPTGSIPGTISGSAFFVDVSFASLRCDPLVDVPCP